MNLAARDASSIQDLSIDIYVGDKTTRLYQTSDKLVQPEKGVASCLHGEIKLQLLIGRIQEVKGLQPLTMLGIVELSQRNDRILNKLVRLILD